MPQPSNAGTSSDPANAITNSNQYQFNPLPQASPNESLFANYLPSTLTRPSHVDNFLDRPQPEQQRHSSNHLLQQLQQDEENWGRFLSQFLGDETMNQARQSSSDNSTHNQNHAVNAPVPSMTRTTVTQQQIALLPMGQRHDPERNEGTAQNFHSAEQSSNPSTSNSRHVHTGFDNDTRPLTHREIANNELHPSPYIQMFRPTSVSHNNGNIDVLPLLSRMEDNRRRQQPLPDADTSVGSMNIASAQGHAQALSRDSVEVNRFQFMNDYREIQAHIAMMNNDTDRHIHTLATGGHTSETAIEITEEEDGIDDDDDDDVIILS